mmetsp:Transcript_120410/g.269155  ORF Transcript_120410/g.269155 Transcript_120410/m.269155 type:complete len:201 (+) Transcript_120410:1701-2303(+)
MWPSGSCGAASRSTRSRATTRGKGSVPSGTKRRLSRRPLAEQPRRQRWSSRGGSPTSLASSRKRCRFCSELPMWATSARWKSSTRRLKAGTANEPLPSTSGSAFRAAALRTNAAARTPSRPSSLSLSGSSQRLAIRPTSGSPPPRLDTASSAKATRESRAKDKTRCKSATSFPRDLGEAFASHSANHSLASVGPTSFSAS